MKRTKFYFCPTCSNVITVSSEADIYCCENKLTPLKVKEAADEHLLTITKIDGEYCVESTHEMTKEHYISFVALVTFDSVCMTKCYAEWHLSVRLPYKRGDLYYYCTNHGLFKRKIK